MTLRTLTVLALTMLLAQSSAAAGASSFLPLEVGKRWVLESPAVEQPVVLEVLAREGDAYRLRFDNPWMKTELIIEPRGDEEYYATGLVMNGQRVPLPPATLYWAPAAAAGTTWENSIGTLSVVGRDKTVRSKGASYADCVQILEVANSGSKLYWTFARGVGFVQFGEGEYAFVLNEQASAAATGSGTTTVAAAATPQPLPEVRVGPVRLGLSANIAGKQAYTPLNVHNRFRRSLEAGVNFMMVSPKWSELEPKPGRYDFGDVDFWVGEARSAGVTMAVNVRVIDTNQRAMPVDLKDAPFDSEQVRKRLHDLIEALLPHLPDHVTLLLVGNEIDAYFDGHRGEVETYAAFFRAAVAQLKKARPGLPVSTTLTFGGLSAAGEWLRPILAATDFLSVTYYPLNPDFTMRPPIDVRADFARILATAAGQKVFLQEVGYPTGRLNASSEEAQALFYANVFDQLEENPGRFLAAHFLFMSDLPDDLVAKFAQYYALPGVDRFASFLKTLGMFDDQDRPKKGWETFRERGRQLAGAAPPASGAASPSPR